MNFESDNPNVFRLLHICHISVLNPAIHPRIFYKIACSQAEMGYRVSIVAQDIQKGKYKKRGVLIHPISNFGRLSFRRIFFSFWIWGKVKKLDADVYMLHAPELLILGWWLKKRRGAKIIYDVHEDYLLNIGEARHYPPVLRKCLGKWVRVVENWAVNWLDAVSYAEEVYDNILMVPKEHKFILRNTFTARAVEAQSEIDLPLKPYILLSGTIAVERGIWETLELWKQICMYHPIELVVAGHCQQPQLLKQIHAWVEKNRMKDKFTLTGGADYVPFDHILSLIKHCWFGIFLYRLQPNIKGKIPTKIYEYMAFDKPLLYSDDPTWNTLNTRYGIGVAYQQGDEIREVLKKMENFIQQSIRHHPSDYSWQADEVELKRMMEGLNTEKTK